MLTFKQQMLLKFVHMAVSLMFWGLNGALALLTLLQTGSFMITICEMFFTILWLGTRHQNLVQHFYITFFIFAIQMVLLILLLCLLACLFLPALPDVVSILLITPLFTVTRLHGPLARYINCRLRMRRECRERFPRHRGLAIPTCITARAWINVIINNVPEKCGILKMRFYTYTISNCRDFPMGIPILIRLHRYLEAAPQKFVPTTLTW